MPYISYDGVVIEDKWHCKAAALGIIIFPWPVSRECIPQEPGHIEYYNQLFCLRGHLGSVSEIQTSLDVSDLKICHKRSRRIDLLFISHTQSHVAVARCMLGTQ